MYLNLPLIDFLSSAYVALKNNPGYLYLTQDAMWCSESKTYVRFRKAEETGFTGAFRISAEDCQKLIEAHGDSRDTDQMMMLMPGIGAIVGNDTAPVTLEESDEPHPLGVGSEPEAGDVFLETIKLAAMLCNLFKSDTASFHQYGEVYVETDRVFIWSR